MNLKERRTLLQTLTAEDVFGNLVGSDSWATWRSCVSAILGVVPDNEEDRAVIQAHTGRSVCPSEMCREAYLIVGRRGGKSNIAAVIAVMLACFRTYALSPGERGVGNVGSARNC